MGGNCICPRRTEGEESEELFFKQSTISPSMAAQKIQRQYYANKGYTEFSKELLSNVKQILSNESGKNIDIAMIKPQEFESKLSNHPQAKNVLDQFSHELSGLVYEGKDNIYPIHPCEFRCSTEGAQEYYYGGWNIKGKSCGIGTLITKEGSVYKGLFNEGLFNGNGILINSNGDYYFGNWKNGECNGYGKLQYKSTFKYDGEFKGNSKSGEGNEYYEDGSYYNGHFENNEKEGKGKMTYADSSFYEGDFSNSLFHGKGMYVWPDGRIYKGDFKNGQMCGIAMHKWNDGSMYSGSYHNNKKHGQGVYVWQAGKELVGNWLNNDPHGNCVYFINGKKYDVCFRFGKIISAKIVNEGSTAVASPCDNQLALDQLEFNKESAMNNDQSPSAARLEALVGENKEITMAGYICHKCNDLLDNPYQCNSCLKNYCHMCIFNPKDNDYLKCVNECQIVEYNINDVLEQEMETFKMNCKCGEVYPYNERRSHQHNGMINLES